MSDEAMAAAVLAKVRDFMAAQRISCEETIYQTDWVIENAYDFIADLCGTVGYPPGDD